MLLGSSLEEKVRSLWLRSVYLSRLSVINWL